MIGVGMVGLVLMIFSIFMGVIISAIAKQFKHYKEAKDIIVVVIGLLFAIIFPKGWDLLGLVIIIAAFIGSRIF